MCIRDSLTSIYIKQAMNQNESEVNQVVASKPKQEQSLGPFMCFFTTFNMMLGCGPIFLPGNFLADGWLLSTLFLFFVGVLSYFTTMFVVESMGLCNAILKKIKTCLVNNF
eukprot:TRINITY_DN25220_c0_g1_i1.p1 TRINITY_DN25220_c0_g1~~TRINITY_DN25220_c0_g1_i1.p1  ORF type:complete len:121 (+),score=15.31 TRINITY_DN25220_c0_g1_i1:33-365(+)